MISFLLYLYQHVKYIDHLTTDFINAIFSDKDAVVLRQNWSGNSRMTVFLMRILRMTWAQFLFS